MSQIKGTSAKDSSSEDDEVYEEAGGIKIGDVYVPPMPAAYCSSESHGPRLVISHIVNENFKSYAGRQVLGPFDKVMIRN